jgi:membrane protease YdiL (CAAX protease family)
MFITEEKEVVWVQILYLFILPVLLLYFGVVPNDFRFVLLLVVSLMLVGIVWHNKWTLHDFAIKKNFLKDFWPYFFFTLAGVLFLIWVSLITTHPPLLNWWKNLRFLLLFIPVSVLQELAFRGVLMKMLRQAFKNPIFIIGLNACVFALIHIIYINATLVLPMTLIAGIGFAWVYYHHPNLILISISHTILNFVGMILGFFIAR